MTIIPTSWHWRNGFRGLLDFIIVLLIIGIVVVMLTLIGFFPVDEQQLGQMDMGLLALPLAILSLSYNTGKRVIKKCLPQDAQVAFRFPLVMQCVNFFIAVGAVLLFAVITIILAAVTPTAEIPPAVAVIAVNAIFCAMLVVSGYSISRRCERRLLRSVQDVTPAP